MMIDRLQELLPHLQYFPPELQEEIASYIQELEQIAIAHGRIKELPQTLSFEEPWEDPAGSLSDLPDDMFEELAKIRHDKAPLGEAWEDPAGAWSDLPDDMFEELDRIRHFNPPTPPIDIL